MHDYSTPDTSVAGLGRVEVYTPKTKKSPSIIARKVEDKNYQSDMHAIRGNFSNEEMESIIACLFGKSKCAHYKVIFFNSVSGDFFTFQR